MLVAHVCVRACQVTNWKPKGVGLCSLTFSGRIITAVDESGNGVLTLPLSADMVYSRPASTFHSLETGPKVPMSLRVWGFCFALRLADMAAAGSGGDRAVFWKRRR